MYPFSTPIDKPFDQPEIPAQTIPAVPKTQYDRQAILSLSFNGTVGGARPALQAIVRMARIVVEKPTDPKRPPGMPVLEPAALSPPQLLTITDDALYALIVADPKVGERLDAALTAILDILQTTIAAQVAIK